MENYIKFTWSANNQDYQIEIPFTFSISNDPLTNVIQLMLSEDIFINGIKKFIHMFTFEVAADIFSNFSKEEKDLICKEYKTAFLSIAQDQFINDKANEFSNQIYEIANQELANQHSDLIGQFHNLNSAVARMIDDFLNQNITAAI